MLHSIHEIVLLLAVAFFTQTAMAFDRIVSLGESPFSAESDSKGDHGKLVNIIKALDQATHSHSKIVLRPFARSLIETAEGRADLHFPLIQNGNIPAPKGLAYVTDVEFGKATFVIYSRKDKPFNANNIATAGHIESEPGHESLYDFPVEVTHCVPCSLNKLLYGRTDALILPDDIIDPLLKDAQYKNLHRALYKSFPVRALVSAHGDSRAARRYLIDGVAALKRAGKFDIVINQAPAYTDWQP